MEDKIEEFATAPSIALEKSIDLTKKIGKETYEISQIKRARNFWAGLGPGLVTGAADDDPAAVGRGSPRGAVRRDLHRSRWRSVGPGRRGASRHLEGADLFRTGSARPSEEGWLSHPRLARGRAQKVRPGKGAQVVPVLEALTASLKLAANLATMRFEKGAC